MNLEKKNNFRFDFRKVEPDYMEFMAEGMELETINAIRRIMIAEVPTLAIETAYVHKNTSPLHDEFICHRLGLIPLDSSRVQQFVEHTECTECETEFGCSKCCVQFELNVRNNNESPLEVTSEHLIPIGGSDKCRPVFYKSQVTGKEVGVPIMILGKGQELNITCTATKGRGQRHAKWSPVSIANFVHVPHIIINQQILDESGLEEKESRELKKKIIDSCPTRVFGRDPLSSNLKVERMEDCMYCDECLKFCSKFGAETKKKVNLNNFISIKPRTDRYLVKIEGTGVMPTDMIFTLALDILHAKMELFIKEAQQIH